MRKALRFSSNLPYATFLFRSAAQAIFEGIDEILTVTRLGLPSELRRSLACADILENMVGTIRRVSRNVKRCRDARMALHWTAAGMMKATKGFRKLKTNKQLPELRSGPGRAREQRRKEAYITVS